MALNFPNNPVVNQVFQSEGMTFVWTGAVWRVIDTFPWASAGGASGVMTPAATRAALDAVPASRVWGLGVPQTFARAAGVNYQWTGSRPLLIAITFWDRDAVSRAELRTGPTNVVPPDINLGRIEALRGNENSIIGVIPAGWWYRLHVIANRVSATQWWEWRNAP
jgi:hypothetical protein